MAIVYFELKDQVLSWYFSFSSDYLDKDHCDYLEDHVHDHVHDYVNNHVHNHVNDLAGKLGDYWLAIFGVDGCL